MQILLEHFEKFINSNLPRFPNHLALLARTRTRFAGDEAPVFWPGEINEIIGDKLEEELVQLVNTDPSYIEITQKWIGA